jgi:hypothetical protein
MGEPMQTKLTLRLEKTLIEQAKLLAQRQNKSLSQLVEEYFRLLAMLAAGKAVTPTEELPPITRSLRGILRGHEIDEQDYRAHLEAKYL